MELDGRLLAGFSVLVAVVESGSFTRAADTLGLSSSGVSRAVSRLEERIGVRLLDRSTRALRLTDEGKRFYTLAAPHLDAIVDAASVVGGASKGVRGKLRASVNQIIAQNLLGPKMAEFAARFPNLSLELLPPDEAGDLISNGIDVAIRFGPQAQSSMSSRLLLETRVLTVAAPAYLEKHGRPATPGDLEHHACIQFPDPFTGAPFEWEFRRDGHVLPVASSGPFLMTDVATMIAACVSGAGIAQVLAISVQPHLASGKLIELFPDWPDETFPLFAVRPSRRLAPMKVAAFVDFCEEICRPYDTRVAQGVSPAPGKWRGPGDRRIDLQAAGGPCRSRS
jgi:DNA-binding transcriptional LysR family regulator